MPENPNLNKTRRRVDTRKLDPTQDLDVTQKKKTKETAKTTKLKGEKFLSED